VKNADENHVVAFRFFSSLVRQPCVLDHSLETEEYLPLAKPYFPSMNARELVDHVRSGPAELVLDKPLPHFRRRTRSNPCDFNEFLDALQSSETIYTAACSSHRQLGIPEDEWVLLFKTLGRIRYMQTLTLWCAVGSRDFHPFQAVAEALHNAHSLCMLIVVLQDRTIPRDSTGMIELVNALRVHTTLEEFMWVDSCVPLESAQSTVLDPVLRALPACHVPTSERSRF
jgi:hypothetical protein